MSQDLTTEELQAIHDLAVGELSAIKAEEEQEQFVNMAEVTTLLSVANKTNPNPEEGQITWDQIPPMPDEEPV